MNCKFTITNKDLKGPLSLAASIAPTTSTLPILENILFADGKLVASDSQAQISIACPVSGNFTASAEKLKKITAAFADDAELAFEVKGDKLTVKSGKSKLTMPVIGADNWPKANMDGDPIAINLKQEDIKFHLQNVMYAIGQNNVIMWMNNLLFLNGKYVAATNLGVAVSQQDVEQEYKFSIPGKAAGQLLRFLGDGEAKLNIYKNKVVFILGDIEFIAPLASQEHPDVLKFIPKPNIPIIFNRDAFLDMSSIAAINASKFAGTKFILAGQELTLECKDFGADSVDSMAVKYAGPDIEFGYNILQLRAAVTSIRSDAVTMHIADNGTALVLSDDSMQKNVLTAMRI